MIEFKCPQCGHQLRVRSKYAGKQGQCKHCKAFVDVPNTYAEDVSLEASPPAADAAKAPVASAEPVGGTALADLLGQEPATVDPPPEPTSASVDGDGEGTALSDLMAGDEVNPTVPMAPDALDELTGGDAPIVIPQKRLGMLYWLLAVFVAPAALVWGVRLPSHHPQKQTAIAAPIAVLAVALVLSIVIFVGNPAALVSFGNDSGDTEYAGPLNIDPPSIHMNVSPNDPETLTAYNDAGTVRDVVWSSSDPSIARVVGADVYGVSPGTATITAELPATGQQALATVVVSGSAGAASTTVANYAETRLPSYPGLLLESADHFMNTLTGPLARTDQAELSTFVGRTSKDPDTVTTFYHQELQNRGWTIDDYGSSATGELYIVGRNAGFGIEYRASRVASRTRVSITYGPIY